MSNSPVIHGQLADFIDYVAFIKMQASTVTYREVDLNNAKMVVDSRPKYKNNKSTKKVVREENVREILIIDWRK